MKFQVSSSALLSVLSTNGKVISNKNSLPILDYFLFELSGTTLKITASDLETTLTSCIEVSAVESEGKVAAPVKLMLDALKEFPEMPLTLETNENTWEIKMEWGSGNLSIPGANPVSYPEAQSLKAEEQTTITLDVDAVVNGINKTIFATADDDLRPVMNGVYININESEITYVATDAHKLVKYTTSCNCDKQTAFILPKKPANLIKMLLLKESGETTVAFDKNNAVFTLGNNTLRCRLIEGNYPNYNAVIPTANPNKLLVDRVELLNGIKRVAVCANPTTNQIKLEIADNHVKLSAQDLNFYVSAAESLNCSYEGEPIVIGFKSVYLVEILSNIETPTVMVELADKSRAGVFKPVYDTETGSKTLMLLMPMMLS